MFISSGNAGSINYKYKYDTITNKYIKLKNLDYYYTNASACVIEDSIYLFGASIVASGSVDNIYAFKYIVPSYKNNFIYLTSTEQSKLHLVLLSKLLTIYFSKAYIYKDDEIKQYECYYGDGEKWNLIS